MKKSSHVAGVVALFSIFLAASCDDAEEGLHYSTTVFPVGEAVWRSDVSADDKAVITNLINNMVKVEACQFYMGAQGKSVKRANYFSSYNKRDTIWLNETDQTAYWRDLKTSDTIWYNPADFHFIDTIKTKTDTTRFANVYSLGSIWVGPVTEISMPDYYIGKFEITQGEWNAVMDRQPTGHHCIVVDTEAAPWHEEIGLGDKYPAYNIWYQDAVDFCDSLSAKTGLNFRLPTEAEWECAARGGRYCRGYKYAGADVASECGWIYSNSMAVMLGYDDYGIHQGGELTANELGLYDMTGNVSEWVANCYYHYAATDSINPQGKAPLNDGQDTLIVRGGSWAQKNYYDFCNANRNVHILSKYDTDDKLHGAFANCGFRICISPQ